MKVGIFTDTYPPDVNGVAASVDTVESALRTSGNEVFVVAPNHKLRYEISRGQHLYKLPSIKFYGEKRLRVALPAFLPKAIYNLPVDIVHNQTPFSIGGVGVRAAKKRKLPLVYTHHTRYENYEHYLDVPGFLLKLVEKPILEKIFFFANKHDAVIAPSRGIKKELESLGITKPIHVIPTGVDFARAEALSRGKDPAALLNKFVPVKTSELVVFASRLAKEKNIEFILDAMGKVLKARPSAHFLIMGDGNERASLQNTVNAMGLEKRITFTGFMRHEDMYPIYRAAKVFVFSSLTETQGLVLLEAMATGLPVVALRATGVEDLLEGNKCGFLVEENNPDSFAKTVIDLLENPGLRKSKSGGAVVCARNFSLDRTTAELLSLYESLINRT